MRKVIVLPYQDYWVALFQKEAKSLKAIFSSEIIDIHHIGSTSVPNLASKPIIDLLIEVKSIKKIDKYNHDMELFGYERKGEKGIAGRRFFQKGGDERTHHVHVFEVGHPEIKRHLLFRDYLAAHPEDAQQYGELKLALAKQFPTDISSYIEGKDSLIKKLEQKANKWNRTNAFL
ncbi:GrpB family protein [Halalkalibacterium ligniniphilum]|uniref:GrpB family protein n=1 Tax=Halalkalibacterium ligniniphilum TaxID=1134413 RepID=UPI000347972C|nr:GrpB family protein [Halalkalibacterium ligniniphilum]